MAIKGTRAEASPASTASNARRIFFLGIGDAIVFLVFAFIGITSHKCVSLHPL
jgi:hypothetical protein